ncbi:MAG TPA: nickel ABC transporter permease [Solirubrobacteraceae bacterium]|nr:nickel ABC transporter permease [Solirubrobacteraceae bacterium]
MARRLLYLPPIWLGITLLAFALSRLTPGDPAQTAFVRIHGRQPTAEELAAIRARLGLDDPPVEQYLDWLGGAVTGDLGTSIATGAPVTRELLQRFPATLEITLAAGAIAIVIAIPVAVVAAVWRNSALDQLTRGGAILAASVPSFWLAFVLIIVFSVKLGLLPAIGRGGLDHLVLPALALGIGEAAILARLARSSLLEVLGEDYILTARAKGLPERAVMVRHALRNSLSAVVTQIGLMLGFLLAYSAIIEVVFVWPGIGRFVVEAIGARDYPVLQGFVVFAGTVFLLINLVVDLVYLWLDPRVTLSGPARTAA